MSQACSMFQPSVLTARRSMRAAIALAALIGLASVTGCDSDDDDKSSSRDDSNEEPDGSKNSSKGSKSNADSKGDDDSKTETGSDGDSSKDAGSNESDSNSEASGDSKDAGSGDAGAGDAGGKDPAPSDKPATDAGKAEEPPKDDGKEHTYVTTSVVFNAEGETTYLSLLPKLDGLGKLDLKNSREFASWVSAWAFDGKLFITDGEAPTVKRFSVDDKRNLKEEGAVSFLSYGVMYADSTVLSANKAYLINVDEVVVWNPTKMEITGSFELPTFDTKPGGMTFDGFDTGRSFVARGNRAFVAGNWANWDESTMSDDSVILVIDTENNKVVKTIDVPCPYLDVATQAEDGTLYFSNWVYSVGQTLVKGTKKACAVRILPGQEELDKDWSLTFADVTEGREGAALQYIGNGQAVFSVYHHERVEDLEGTTDLSELGNASNWRLWLLDLKTKSAKLIDGIDWNAGGLATQFVDNRGFVLVPTGEYEETTVYEVLKGGAIESRWTTPGWSMNVFKLR